MYALIQCIALPSLLGLYGLLKLVNMDLSLYQSVVFKYAVSIFRFVYTLTRDYCQFHSLIIALTRYAFIVYDIQSEVFGIKNVRSLVIKLSIGVPLITATLYDATVSMEKSYVSWFYGGEHSQNLNASSEHYSQVSHITYESPLYTTCHAYLPSSFVYAMGLIENAMFSIIYSNICEGFIYAHIFIFCNR